jgi:hypothetical protein
MLVRFAPKATVIDQNLIRRYPTPDQPSAPVRANDSS